MASGRANETINTLSDLCSFLENDDNYQSFPRFGILMRILIYANKHTFTLFPQHYTNKHTFTLFPQHYMVVEDQSFDVLMYGRLASALNGTFINVSISSTTDDRVNIEDILANNRKRRLCIGAFFSELIRKTSIISQLRLQLFPLDCITTFLISFLRHKQGARTRLFLDGTPNLEQATAISNRQRRIEWLGMNYVHQRRVPTMISEGSHRCDDHLFRIIMSNFSNITKLFVGCYSDAQVSCVCLLLQQTNELNELRIWVPSRLSSRSLSNIFEALHSNSRLLSLEFETEPRKRDLSLEEINWIENLLCDASTIDTIRRSNHTLNKATVNESVTYSRHVRKCLELNINPDKGKVIRNKIFQFYFGREFDMSPFSAMPVSVLTNVLGEINEHKLELSVMYRFVSKIPELSHVSRRQSTLNATCSKRLKLN